jgi:ankyrin repeat protein
VQADWTPLRYAIEHGHTDLVRLLLDNGAPAKEMVGRGVPLVELAMDIMDIRKKEIVQLLLSYGANPTIHIAAYMGDVEIIKDMLDNGVNVNQPCAGGYTPLHYAVRAGHESVARLLIAKGAQVNFDDSEDMGRTIDSPLHIAAYEGNVDIVRLLITSGANIDANDNSQSTPLHLAAFKGHKDVVELLLSHGAKIDAQDYDSCTPLYNAAHAGYKDIVELLLTKGADVSLGRIGDELALTEPTPLSQEKLVERIFAVCKPYSIIVTDPKFIQEYLQYNGIHSDDFWIPEQADIQKIDPVLRAHLRENIVVGAKEHFDPARVLSNLHLYNREYAGITRGGRRYIICQMNIHDLHHSKPMNTFSIIHGSGNGVVRFVFDLESEKIVHIDCEYLM